MAMATAKLTVSVKRRLGNGDEVFIAPGVEIQCSPDELDAKQAEAEERVNGWMEQLLEAYPDVDLEEDEVDEDEDEDDDDDDDDGGDVPDGDEDEEEELTEADIKKMKKADLQELAEEYELELESTKVADMRAEIIEALFEEEDEEDEDEEEGFTEEELSGMKLNELQEIVDQMEIDHPAFKKGTKLPAKKAGYVEHILEAQEEE